jgi:hypothetical protein
MTGIDGSRVLFCLTMDGFLQKLGRLALLAATAVSGGTAVAAEYDSIQDEMRETFASASPLDRVYVVTSWALSPMPPVRLAIARVLGDSFELVGARTAIEHLCSDPDEQIREVAQRAAQRGRPVT